MRSTLVPRVRNRRKRADAAIESSSGFPRSVLFLFLALAVGLGLLISWALGLSVQVQNTSSQASFDSQTAAGTDESGLTLLTENSLGAEVQSLIDTGTLQNPATFDVTTCLSELGVSDSVVVLEEVSWENEGPAWLIVHSASSLGSVRKSGGEVSAAIVRSTCGTGNSSGARASTLWSGTVLVAPLN